MRKKRYLSYVILSFVLLGLFYIPKRVVEGVRSMAVGIVSRKRCSASSEKSDIEKLQLKCLLLQNRNTILCHRLLKEEKVEGLIQKVKELTSLDEKKISDFYARRRKSHENLLKNALFALPAEVIYRDLVNWNSTLWVNVGAGEVAVNSPVLKGENLIGLVEYVGKDMSRVHLLTHSLLVPSVRVVREGRYLAKGELYGSSSSVWRGCSAILKGVGFNYDFDDDEGSARELRSGRPLGRFSQEKKVALIDEGDLLVTTGMDGVFPKDLPVAIVTEVGSLKEGSVSFEVKARLCAGNLKHLENVYILPPLTLERADAISEE